MQKPSDTGEIREMKPKSPEQRSQTDIVQREGRFIEQVYTHICGMIDQLHRIKEVPGGKRVLLDQEQRDRLKQQIRNEIILLRSNSSTAFNEPGKPISGKFIRSAIMKRYMNAGVPPNSPDWLPNGKYAKFTETDAAFAVKFREVREKHESLENHCGLSTIAKIKHALNGVETNRLYPGSGKTSLEMQASRADKMPIGIESNDPLCVNLKIIEFYLNAKGGYSINEARKKLDEIHRLCSNPENKGEIVRTFREHLKIQPQENQPPKRKFLENQDTQAKDVTAPTKRHPEDDPIKFVLEGLPSLPDDKLSAQNQQEIKEKKEAYWNNVFGSLIGYSDQLSKLIQSSNLYFDSHHSSFKTAELWQSLNKHLVHLNAFIKKSYHPNFLHVGGRLREGTKPASKVNSTDATTAVNIIFEPKYNILQSENLHALRNGLLKSLGNELGKDHPWVESLRQNIGP
ncbi:MAG: hypothetical protein ACHQT8_05345 [Chlamydiales bacterium]